jgi:predicted metal-binding membrane protein
MQLPPPRLPLRDRLAILTGLLGLTALAWVYLVVMARGMSTMPMGEMMQLHPWSLADFAMMLAMWVVMMIGMMLPSAVPMTLIYAAIGRKAAREGTPIAPTAAFVSGYVAMWSLFSVGATLAQWGLERAALLSPMLVSTSPALGGGLLVVVGLYQWTPYKDACLQHCRAPAQFISEHWRSGAAGAWRMGLEHGAYCLGCCWLLMALLFVGGVMNLLWIALITLFVLLEKILPLGAAGGRLAGGAMIAAGVFAIYHAG